MRRTRLVRGLLVAGFVILAAELGLAGYSAYRATHWATSVHHLVTYQAMTWSSVIGVYLPVALLLVAALIAGELLYRSFRDRLRWSWFVGVLSPLAALLVTHPPWYGLLHAEQASMPWAAPYWLASWSPGVFSLVLQIAVYGLLPVYAAAALMSVRRETEGKYRRQAPSFRKPAATR